MAMEEIGKLWDWVTDVFTVANNRQSHSLACALRHVGEKLLIIIIRVFE